jgi:MFS family permease
VSVTVAASVGGMLAPGHAWATLPYGFQFAAVAAATYPAASFMRRYGRKRGFLSGAVFLIAAGCTGYYAITRSSFPLLIIAHGMLGIYVAFANFYRFAAVDALSPVLRAKGVSLVVAGGIAAAISGPLLSIGLKDVHGFATFSLCYGSFVLLGFATIALMALWRPGEAPVAAAPPVEVRTAAVIAPLAVATVASAVSYFIMNMLMVQASLVMESMCVSFDTSSFAIQGHVIAMFAPSFVTGAIVARAGHRSTLIAGYMLMAGSTALSLLGTNLWTVAVALIMLGVGWNFGYVGGGALLARTLTDHNRHRIQGINDSVIAISATAGAFLPALLQTSIGWQNTNLLCLALCVAGASLTYICMRKAQTSLGEVLRS